jgi:two-component system OmpR family response regulator
VVGYDARSATDVGSHSVARLLIIEDEPAIAKALAEGLREEGYHVEIARDGESGLWAARTGEHALVLLDLQLPKLPGLDVCRRLREQGRTTPILMLTARDTVSEIVGGLDAGANDYLVKPFAFAELLARVRALLRAAAGAVGAELTVGDVRLDSRALRVWRGGTEVALTVKELRLLEHLLRHKGQVVSRQRLTAALWDHDNDPDSNALEVHVASLRKKLGRGSDTLLHTVRGVGYVVREPGA